VLEILVGFVFGVIFGAFSASVAGEKGYRRLTWIFAGFFFGPIGFLAALGLPDLKQRRYLRLLLEHYGVSHDSKGIDKCADKGDADAQRRRILGGS
jgi:hypothetical protein